MTCLHHRCVITPNRLLQRSTSCLCCSFSSHHTHLTACRGQHNYLLPPASYAHAKNKETIMPTICMHDASTYHECSLIHSICSSTHLLSKPSKWPWLSPPIPNVISLTPCALTFLINVHLFPFAHRSYQDEGISQVVNYVYMRQRHKAAGVWAVGMYQQ
jgi:hypothetical protein